MEIDAKFADGDLTAGILAYSDMENLCDQILRTTGTTI